MHTKYSSEYIHVTYTVRKNKHHHRVANYNANLVKICLLATSQLSKFTLTHVKRKLFFLLQFQFETTFLRARTESQNTVFLHLGTVQTFWDRTKHNTSLPDQCHNIHKAVQDTEKTCTRYRLHRTDFRAECCCFLFTKSMQTTPRQTKNDAQASPLGCSSVWVRTAQKFMTTSQERDRRGRQSAH